MVLGCFVLAAAVGAVLRYLADVYLSRRGILLVNVLGSGLAGIVLGLAWNHALDEWLVVPLLGGLAGSLTTYSTVAAITAQQRIEQRGSVTKTWLAHVGLSILACYLGLVMTLSGFFTTAIH